MFRVIYHQAHHIWCATTVSLGQSGGKRDQAKGRPYEVSLAPQTHDDYPKSRAALGQTRKRLATWLHEQSIQENESQSVMLSAQQLSGGTTPSGGAYDI